MKLLPIFLLLVSCANSNSEDLCVKHWESMDYDQLARTAHLQGQVKLVATIAADGSVEEVKIILAHAGGTLPEAAAKNLRGWKFNGGTPRTFEFTYDFRLVNPAWNEAPTRMTIDLPKIGRAH